MRTVSLFTSGRPSSGSSYENEVYSPTCTSSPSIVFNNTPFNQTIVSYPQAPKVNCNIEFGKPFPFSLDGKGKSRSYQATTLSCQVCTDCWPFAAIMCS